MRSDEGFSDRDRDIGRGRGSGRSFNAGPVARQIMNYYFGKRTLSSPILPLPKGVK